MAGVSVEATLELWASSVRNVKARVRSLFTQERVAASAGQFLDGLPGEERRKTGWMPLPLPRDAAISRSLKPWPNFNRETSCVRRMFYRPVGILPPSFLKGHISSDCRPNLPTLAQYQCPTSREMRGRHHAKLAAIMVPDFPLRGIYTNG